MKKMFLYCAVLSFLWSCKSVKNYNEQITKLHAVSDLHSDVDEIYKQFQKHHPKLYQYTPKQVLDSKFDSLKKTIIKPMDSRSFYKKLAPVITHIKQGHVALNPPNKRYTKKEIKVLNKQKFQFYDLDFSYVEGKLRVKNYRGKDSTLIGSEVLSINGESASDLAKSYKTLFSSDGFNKTFYNRYVAKNFSNFYFKDKGFKDSLSVTFRSQDTLFSKMFRRVNKLDENKNNKTKDTAFAEIRKQNKLNAKERRAKRLIKRRKRKVNKKFGFLAKRKQYTRNFNFIGQDSSVAYMKIRSFTNGNYKKFYKESFAKIDSAKTKNFILDLRDNGGGRIAEIDYLYAFLALKDYQFLKVSEVNSRTPFLKAIMSNTTPNAIKALSALIYPIILVDNFLKTQKQDDKIYYRFKKYTKIKKPKDLNYKGAMYVLINGNSFSASSLISTHLKGEKRATFIGEETGGAYNGTVAGIYKVYELPTSKIKVRIGLMQIEAPQKQQPDGYGVKPDIEILPKLKDSQSNLDTELEWVLKNIEKGN